MKKLSPVKSLRATITAICVACSLLTVVLIAVTILARLGRLDDDSEIKNLIGILNDYRLEIIVISVVSVAISALLGYMLARTLSGRVKKISDHVGRLTEGDYSSRVNIVDGGGEIGQLAAATNALGERLGAMDIAVDTGEKELENKQLDFVANVTHELKTPLTIIKTHTETLLGGTVKDPDLEKSLLQNIDMETDRISRIVRDLIQLSRLNSVNDDFLYKRLKLKQFLDSFETRAREYAERAGVNVRFYYSADPNLLVMADYTKLESILKNIVVNSIHYTNKGGLVELRADADDKNVRIRISDNGVGIREEDIPRVFDRFFRADKARSRASGGTGLGLAIAKEYVNAHGGSIRLESEYGKGTTVFIDLPIVVQTGAGDE